MAIQASPSLLFLSSRTCCLPVLCTRIIICQSRPPFPLGDVGGSCSCQAEARAHLKKYHGGQPRVRRKLSTVRTSCQQPSSSLYNFLALKKKKKEDNLFKHHLISPTLWSGFQEYTRYTGNSGKSRELEHRDNKGKPSTQRGSSAATEVHQQCGHQSDSCTLVPPVKRRTL